jgi:O-antigen/teichoic acid export membrane protein
LDSSGVGKNIWYASITYIFPPILTYAFWFVAAKVAGAGPLGVASSIASLVLVISTIDALDAHLGMKRLLGIAISAGDLEKFKQIFTSACLVIAVTVTASAALIAIPNLKILESIGIDRQYAWAIIAMVIAQPFQFLFIETLIVALQSKKIVGPFLLGSVCRFPVLFVASYLFSAPPTTATIVAFSSTLFVSTIWFGIDSIRIIQRRSHQAATANVWRIIKKILRAGLSSWIPTCMQTIGFQLGVITVLSSGGATEAGKLYVIMGIFLVSQFIVTGVTKVTHPLFASLEKEEDRTKLLSYTTTIAFIFTLPIAMPLLFFGQDFLGLLGSEYRSTANSMAIFISSLPLEIVYYMIFYFVYGRGDNKAVFYLGIVGNAPRILLYFLLSPLLGIDGAALSWLAGSIIQLPLCIKVQKNYSLVMEYKKYSIITLLPFIIGAILYVAQLNFAISTVIIFVGSFVLYTRLKLFTNKELHDVVYTGLPYNIAQKVYPVLLKIMQKIN